MKVEVIKGFGTKKVGLIFDLSEPNALLLIKKGYLKDAMVEAEKKPIIKKRNEKINIDI